MKHALIVVDIQQGLLVDDLSSHNISGVFEQINRLADRGREAEDPVDIRLRKSTTVPYASSNLEALLDERSVRGVSAREEGRD